jgi:hypothetical protein
MKQVLMAVFLFLISVMVISSCQLLTVNKRIEFKTDNQTVGVIDTQCSIIDNLGNIVHRGYKTDKKSLELGRVWEGSTCESKYSADDAQTGLPYQYRTLFTLDDSEVQEVVLNTRNPDMVNIAVTVD